MSRAERKHLEIEDTKRTVYLRDRGVCHAPHSDGGICGRPGNQCGHILPQDDIHIARYGEELIHCAENMVLCCSLACNKKVEINRRGRPLEADAFAELLRKIMEEN